MMMIMMMMMMTTIMPIKFLSTINLAHLLLGVVDREIVISIVLIGVRPERPIAAELRAAQHAGLKNHLLCRGERKLASTEPAQAAGRERFRRREAVDSLADRRRRREGI